jgi:hypothetical protein
MLHLLHRDWQVWIVQRDALPRKRRINLLQRLF